MGKERRSHLFNCNVKLTTGERSDRPQTRYGIPTTDEAGFFENIFERIRNVVRAMIAAGGVYLHNEVKNLRSFLKMRI
jgi:hypothetical protein